MSTYNHIEAIARLYDLAAELRRRDLTGRPDLLTRLAFTKVKNVRTFGRALSDAGFSADRVEREVKRLSALASGRLVRVIATRYRVRSTVLGYLIAFGENRHEWAREAHAAQRRTSAMVRQYTPLEFESRDIAKRISAGAGEGARVVPVTRTTIQKPPQRPQVPSIQSEPDRPQRVAKADEARATVTGGRGVIGHPAPRQKKQSHATPNQKR